MKNLRLHLLTLASLPIYSASAADLYWDGNGSASAATGGAGTWSTANAWRDGSATGTLQSWVDGNTAVLGGTAATITISTTPAINQIRFLTTGYGVGAAAAGPITFTGTYSDEVPTLDNSSGTLVAGKFDTTVSAKITGAISGGLVIKDINNITTPTTAGRFYLNAASTSDFTGDVTVLGGNLHVLSNLGDAGNKIILKGGSYLYGNSGVTYDVNRTIDVAANSGIATRPAASAQTWNFNGPITGSANLTRYNGTDNGTINILLKGDMSGFTGVFENRGGTSLGEVVIETSATSGGGWKLTSGTVKLNTVGDDAAIAHGALKSDLLMNGGTLNMNGKSETINGLSGPTGTVNNGLTATTSTLTVGANDATASFGGTIVNGTGTVALTKTGSGTQTLGGGCTFTGATSVDGGTLVINGSLAASPMTVKTGAALTVTGVLKNLQALTLEADTTLSVPLTVPDSEVQVTTVLTLSGGTVTLVPTLATVPTVGVHTLMSATGSITGSATLTTDFGASRVNGSSQVVGNAIELTISSIGADLVWNDNAATGSWDLNSSLNFLNGASNDVFKQYDSVTFGPGSPAGTISLTGSLVPTAVTVDSTNSFTFNGSGSIGGAATLTKDGSGTLTVANTNSFTGDTTVSGGTLEVNGTLGTSEVLVESGGTLTGTGTIAGFVTVDGTLAPGSGVGTLSTGAMDLGGTYNCDLDGATIDKLAVTGNLDLTGATLTVNVAAAPTALNYVIATYTGSLTGSFASIPAGYTVDTSVPGQILLWPSVTTFPAGTITFETDQSYPAAPAVIAAVDTAATFTGTNGWSLVTSGDTGNVRPVASSGHYLGGQAIGASSTGTYIGGINNVIQYTGANTITFDAPFFSGTSVGFMCDLDNDGQFDTADSGMAFGVGGSPARFQYRNAAFGGENFGTGFTGTAGHWYRFTVTIGESVGGNRAITMAVHNLTTNTGFDFNTGTPEIADPWSFTVTDAQFGTVPELSAGLFVRTTSGARIDNLRVTSVSPPVGPAYLAWLDGFPALTGNQRLPDADPDHDGIKNLLEFVLNGNPTLSDPSILPTGIVSGGNLVFTFHRRDDSEGLVTQTFQHGTNLTDWTDLVIGEDSGAGYTVDELDAAPDLITVTIPTGSEPKIFARLLVSEIP